MKKLLLAAACAALLGAPASAVTIDWVTVGDPGNAPDAAPGTADCGPSGVGNQPCGAVATTYRIGKYEVTNAQYAEFLNAVAATDTYALYNTDMGNPAPVSFGYGGITRSGSSGSFTYSAIAGRESTPLNYVPFWNALRFANWLHNGQPIGAQDNATTEGGAYTITDAGIAANSITRNSGATVFLPSDDEWYKAAYYDPVSTAYFAYPAGTNTPTVCAMPGATANTANCGGAVGDLTDVGSYWGSASPNGTFDQGGNVLEWNEDIRGLDGSYRRLRGGYFDVTIGLEASSSSVAKPEFVGDGGGGGFRVASLPEPRTGLLMMTGVLGLATLRVRRRRF